MVCKKFSETGFTKLFLRMKKSKKSGAGHAEVWRLSSGVVGIAGNDLNVKTAVFYLLVMIPIKGSKIALSGLKNGY